MMIRNSLRGFLLAAAVWSGVFSLSGCGPCPCTPPVTEGEAPHEGDVEAEAPAEGEAPIEGEAPVEGEGEGQAGTEGESALACSGNCSYEIVKTYPHDPEAFTQGLLFDEGVLYEGTGNYGASTLRKVDLDTGVAYQIQDLARYDFGEGITIVGNEIFQLTWRNKKAYVYDKTSFERLREYAYETEGWGLTYDGSRLIMSDGSSTLFFRDPATFEEITRITVRDGDQPVAQLNELEYIDGVVYANIWRTNRIAKISPATGKISGWIFLEGLLTQEEQAQADVLNGIAYDALTQKLYVTGKYWPKLFEIRLKPVS